MIKVGLNLLRVTMADKVCRIQFMNMETLWRPSGFNCFFRV